MYGIALSDTQNTGKEGAVKYSGRGGVICKQELNEGQERMKTYSKKRAQGAERQSKNT